MFSLQNALNKNIVLKNTTKSPIFGNNAATYTSTTNNAPVNNGYTLNISTSADDANISATLQFTFYLNGAQTNIFPCSNTYITFGTGSTVYSSLSATNPPYPKIMLGSADNSWQRVWSLNTSKYYRIRYEGTRSTGGTPGSPNIVYEATIVNPSYYGDGNQYVEILFGTNASSANVFMIANTNTNLATNTLAQLTSYVFVGNKDGTVWSCFIGCLNNPPY